MNQPPTINLEESIYEVSQQITAIRRKTHTLSEYYISPNPVPKIITLYQQPLSVLDARLESLSRISFTPHLSRLLDHAQAHGAASLKEIVDELINAAHGLKQIFEQHYDAALIQRQPYRTIHELLYFREDELRKFIDFDFRNPRSMAGIPGAPTSAGESSSPTAPRSSTGGSTQPPTFCTGAIQMLNGRDGGQIKPVASRDLSEANRGVVSRFGGGYLWWNCPHCKYQCKFHMVNSNNSSIHGVEEVRDHAGLDVEYRSAWLAKCHVVVSESSARRPSSTGFGSWASSWRSSDSSNFTPRYGCVFCYAEGKPLSRDRDTVFEAPRDYAEHLVDRHAKNLPPSLLLQHFRVAVKGKSARGVRRWDVNFK